MQCGVNPVGAEPDQVEVCPQIGQRLVSITGVHDEAMKPNGIARGQAHAHKRQLVI